MFVIGYIIWIADGLLVVLVCFCFIIFIIGYLVLRCVLILSLKFDGCWLVGVVTVYCLIVGVIVLL